MSKTPDPDGRLPRDREPEAPPRGVDERAGDAAKVKFGLKWTALSMVFFRFARLATTIVLARILTEEDFGLVTLAMAFILAFQALRDIGFGPAYVQRRGLAPDEDRTFTSTMFWVVLGINSSMFLVGWMLAPFAASFFSTLDGLTWILRGVFGLLLIEAISITPTAILQKRLAFGLIAVGEVTGIVTYGVLSIVFALLGFGAWSIIIGTLGSRLLQSLLTVRLARWRPTMEFSRHAAGQLFGFGRYLWGNSLLGASSKIVDKMVVGKLFSGATLGVYGNAYNLCTTASKPIFSLILRVTFPALSKIQHDLPAMRRAVMAAVSNVALVTVPLSVGLAVTAYDFVAVVYEERWLPMVPIVRVLAFYGIVASLASITAPVLMAIGRVKQLFLFSLAGQIAMVAMFVVLRPFGAMGIAIGLLSSIAAAETGAFVYAARCLELSLRVAAAPVLRVALAAGAMAVAVGLTQWGLGGAPDWLRLGVSVAVGALTYGTAQLVTNRDRFLESVEGLRGVIGATGKPA